MQATTWIDRISGRVQPLDERKQTRGTGATLRQAVKLYLRDASDCLARNVPVKAALSCSAAADCLSKGRIARPGASLYREAALAYLRAPIQLPSRSGSCSGV